MTLDGPTTVNGVSIMVRQSPYVLRLPSSIATQIYSNDGGTHVSSKGVGNNFTSKMMQEVCARVPNRTEMLEVVMGNVSDLFRPSPGNDWCDMLQSSTKHEFYTGSGWVIPAYTDAKFGGSARFWPQANTAGNDTRQYLSFWGHRGGGRGNGGCCSLDYADDASNTGGSSGWGRPFVINAIHTTQGAGYSGIEVSTSTDDGNMYTQHYARYEMFGEFERNAAHKILAADFEYDTFVMHRFASAVDGVTNIRVHFDYASHLPIINQNGGTS